MALRLLITGGSGRLGKQLKKLNPTIYAPTHREMDLVDRDAVFDVVQSFMPDSVIHCAAYTNVAGAEKDRQKCWNTNIEGTRNILEICEMINAVHFTYISTACVFRGDKGNYTELDIPYPKNFYGLTKLVGEILVHNSGLEKWLIVRTNFVERCPWPYKKAFVNRWGTYLYTDQVAEAVLKLVNENVTGIVHVCGEEKISMFDLAKKYSPSVEPLTLEEYYTQNPDAPALTQDMSLKSVTSICSSNIFNPHYCKSTQKTNGSSHKKSYLEA